MNKIVISMCGLVALGMSGMVSAGVHTTGYVYIGTTYMYGTMNNRYNTSTVSYIGGSGYVNSSVNFHGRDGGSTYFSCYVPTTSALYAGAVEVKDNMKNGSYVYIVKSSTSNECTTVYMQNNSRYLD